MKGLSPSQLRCLSALSADRVTRVPALADLLGAPPEGAARTASSLVGRGLAVRVEEHGHVGYLKARGAESAVESSRSASSGDQVTSLTASADDAAESDLADDVAASLALLHHIGGKAYIGAADDRGRNTIAKTSADELERRGLIEFQQRPSYRVAVLVEIRSPA